MPLPGQLTVRDEFRVQPRVNRDQRERLYTRLEKRRNAVPEETANQANPSAPDWLKVNHPMTPIPSDDKGYRQDIHDRNREVNELGQSANDAVASGAQYREREAAARALAELQAMRERSNEILGAVGDLSFDFGGSIGEGATGKRADVIRFGKQLLGQPYQWGGGHGSPRIGPVDCSGLVRYAFLKAGIKGVPQVSQTQMTWGKRTSISKLLPGDLVGRGYPAHHVAIYLGGGKILEAQKSGTRVHIRSIKGQSGWWGVHLNY